MAKVEPSGQWRPGVFQKQPGLKGQKRVVGTQIREGSKPRPEMTLEGKRRIGDF